MSLLKIDSSGKYELSLKDLRNITYLAMTYCAGFYFANTEMVNTFISEHISAEYAGIATAFIYYIFKQFKSDNSSTTTESE